jgi:immunoglobulin-binding protein 1
MLNNPAQRREVKIQQYQTEKRLKSQIQVCVASLAYCRLSIPTSSQTLRSRTLASNVEEPANNYDSIRMLLATPESSHAGSVNAANDDPDMDDETRRELSLALLRLFFTQAHASLQQIADELQILQKMPPPPSGPAQSQSIQPRDDTWRLDMTTHGGLDGKGPLLDPQGRPLRPFTILPSNVAERTRLQQEVFRPDHRLPTMTIEEYLAEEERRGNILRGGGYALAALLLNRPFFCSFCYSWL